MATLVSIRNSIDTRDEFYETEHEFYNSNLPAFEEHTQNFMLAVYDSPHRAELEKAAGSLMFRNMEMELKTFSPAVIDLLGKENKLVSDYQKLTASVKMDGKDVRLINIHVDWADTRVRTEQLRQIREYASQFEYCIIIGDFNPIDCIDMKGVSDRITDKEDLAPFVDAGYIVANGGEFGLFNTLPTSKHAPVACDNILVTPNIKLAAVNAYTAPRMNDHAVLYADISVE